MTKTISNLLNQDGDVRYYGKVFNEIACDLFEHLLLSEIKWDHDQAIIFGKRFITKRKVAWYASRSFNYTYSKITKTALPFTPALLEIKEHIEKLSGATYNSCLLNLYHTGMEGMAWHSDGEKELEKHGTIASVSFGAQRKFSFKHKKDKCKVDIDLEAGSLLVMSGVTQDHWLHRLPPTKKVQDLRINLTFRTIESAY